MDDIRRAGRSGGPATPGPANDLAKVGQSKELSPHRNNSLECPTGIRGHWKDGRYIPEPAVAKFEQQLGAIIAARPCAGCGLPRGPGPLIASRRRFYHPACAPARAGSQR